MVKLTEQQTLEINREYTNKAIKLDVYGDIHKDELFEMECFLKKIGVIFKSVSMSYDLNSSSFNLNIN